MPRKKCNDPWIGNKDLKMVLDQYKITGKELEQYDKEGRIFKSRLVKDCTITVRAWNDDLPPYRPIGVKVSISGSDGLINVTDYYNKLDDGTYSFLYRSLPKKQPITDEEKHFKESYLSMKDKFLQAYDEVQKISKENRALNQIAKDKDKKIAELESEIKKLQKDCHKLNTEKVMSVKIHNARGAGRHKKDYSREIEQILHYKDSGMDYKKICALMNISTSTYYRVLKNSHKLLL